MSLTNFLISYNIRMLCHQRLDSGAQK